MERSSTAKGSGGGKGRIVPLPSERETDAQKAKRPLPLEEELYRGLFENAREAFILVDTEGRVTRVNRFVEEYGFERKDLIGRKLFDFIAPEDMARSSTDFQALLGGAPVAGEMDVVTPKGIITVEYRDNPIRRGDRIVGVQIILTDITGRRRAEKAAVSGDQLLKATLRACPIGIGLVRDRVFQWCNKAVEDLTGYQADFLIGKSLRILCPSDEEYERVGRAIGEGLDRAGFAEAESSVVRKDGTTFDCHLRVSLLDPLDPSRGYVGALTDITQRKETEAALSLSRRVLEISNRQVLRKPMLEEVVDVIRDFTGCEAVGIRLLDEQGNIPYQHYVGFSRKFYETESALSIKNDQCMCINVVMGKTDPTRPFYTPGGSFFMNGTTRFLATVSEQDKGRTRNVCNQQGYESVALIPIRTDDRVLGLIHLADRHENMVPRRLVVTLESIAMPVGAALRRILAEEALRESEQKFRELFENAGEAIVITGPDGVIINANQFVGRYGFEKGDLIGRDSLHFVAEPYREKAAEDLERSQRGTAVEGELVAITPKGRVMMHYVDTPIVRDGKVVGVQSILIDVTERKRTERQLLNYQSRLRALAAELTLAEERERRRIAVGVHDQIAQRLALAKLSLQSLGASSGEANTARMLEGICNEMDRVIEDAHSLTFELSCPILYEVGFEAAVESWLARQVRDCHGIEYTFEAGQWRLDLDKELRVALFQVVRELLTNVIKHAKAKHVDVRIEKTGETMQITVQDDGVGFRPVKLSRSGSKSGGFGLFYVREKLGYLGGSFKVESARGKGTCIVIVVPLGRPSGPGKKERQP